MTVNDIVKALNLKVISGSNGLSNEISGGYTSDLLSDVMGHAQPGNIWITLQTHKNIMAVASLKDLAAIVIIKDFMPGDDAIEKSDEEHIPILCTSLGAFGITGKIYNLMQASAIQSVH
jgi:predicted transcriptional regulator